jgi:uncharacterized membrane protein
VASESTKGPGPDSAGALAKAAAELAATDEAVDGEVVDGASPHTPMVRAIQMLSEHQGPLPSQEWLTTTEQLAPGTTKELVADYVAERAHQRTIQMEAVQIDRENFKSFSTYQTRQLLAAWTLVALIAAGGIVLIALGESIAGLVTLVAELAILAGVFLGRQVIESKSAAPAQLPSQRDQDSLRDEASSQG